MFNGFKSKVGGTIKSHLNCLWKLFTDGNVVYSWLPNGIGFDINMTHLCIHESTKRNMSKPSERANQSRSIVASTKSTFQLVSTLDITWRVDILYIFVIIWCILWNCNSKIEMLTNNPAGKHNFWTRFNVIVITNKICLEYLFVIIAYNVERKNANFGGHQEWNLTNIWLNNRKIY